jgi:tRNA(fMet)-specific endonuclease VapC
MLDTNICIYLIRKKPVQVIKRLQNTSISEIGISVVTLSELEYGIAKSSNKTQNRMALAEFLAPLEVMAFTEPAAAKYGEIRAFLETKGTPIGTYDMMIAAHALSLNLILVTNNTRELKNPAASCGASSISKEEAFYSRLLTPKQASGNAQTWRFKRIPKLRIENWV